MKDEILQTSLQQFLKCGIREMSVQKLVAPLGISTKTVYKYFKNKEELLEESLQLFFSQQNQLFEDLVKNRNTVTVLFEIWHKGIEMEYNVNKKLFHDLHYYYPELEKRVDAINAKKFWKRFIDIIQKGIAESVFRKDIIPEVVLEGISVLYLSIVRIEQFKKFRVSTWQILLNTITAYMRGICTEKGVHELDKYISTYKRRKKFKAAERK